MENMGELNKVEKSHFGGWSIDIECYYKILELIPKGSKILEFGSGSVTKILKIDYEVTSIEHNKDWITSKDIIYAPLKKNKNGSNIEWYDIEVVKNTLDKEYDLILVDGPPQSTNGHRHGFLQCLEYFNLKKTILIFDDVHRESDLDLLKKISNKLNRGYEIFKSGDVQPKKFGVLYK